MISRSALAAALLAALALLISACSGGDSGSGGDSLDVVAYSTPQELYEDDAEPAFSDTPDGEGVEFTNSFGASGDQSRAVESGLPASIVHFALETDMTRAVEAGLVPEDWNRNEYEGIVQNSVVVFVTRPGNPKNIETWEDIVSDDVEVVTPNPFTSGGARWNIMAAYGSQIEQGKSPEEAISFVGDVLANTVVQDASARDALQTFVSGQGDVLLSYENEAIQAQTAGEDVDYVIPPQTIEIETPFAVTTEAEENTSAQAFSDFMFSEQGQTLFAERGFRPVDPKVLARFEKDFPDPETLFTIADFGGWEQVADEFFDPESGSVAEIERDLGEATE